MKSIIVELVYRGWYIFLAYIGIETCFYFYFGIMCEYILTFCQCHYQSIDFGFYNLLQHYSNPYIHSKSGGLLLNDNDTELSYQSKSWGLLGLNGASYLHDGITTYWLLLWYYKFYPLLFIFAFQYAAFMYPGVSKQIRNMGIAGGVHMLILYNMLCVLAIPLLVMIHAEFQIEPFDSELIMTA